MFKLALNNESTWEFPWIKLVQIDLGYYGNRQWRSGSLFRQVMHDQLLVSRVKPKACRQIQLSLGISLPRHRHYHINPWCN